MNIYEKLTAVQSELKAPKSQYNSFGKYSYRSCEDILEAVKPLLKQYELTLTLSDEPIAIGERFYIKAEAVLSSELKTVAHEGRFDIEHINVVAYAREDESKKGMDGAQLTGATSSYARKYALNGLFLIDDSKDADTDAYTKQTTPKPKRYICDDCGSYIQDANGATAEQIAKATKTKYGRYICKTCIDKHNAENNIAKLENSGIPVEVM